jgi:hypothetical protein
LNKLIETLDMLPAEHLDRNRPLVGCYYRWREGKAWNQILITYAIARVTFNDLSAAWHENDIFCWNPYESEK